MPEVQQPQSAYKAHSLQVSCKQNQSPGSDAELKQHHGVLGETSAMCISAFAHDVYMQCNNLCLGVHRLKADPPPVPPTLRQAPLAITRCQHQGKLLQCNSIEVAAQPQCVVPMHCAWCQSTYTTSIPTSCSHLRAMRPHWIAARMCGSACVRHTVNKASQQKRSAML